MRKGWKIYWLIVVVAIAIYGVMVGWSLPLISAEAGGLRPFDLRPAGYDLKEAMAFLSALSDTGRLHYLGAQHRLDMFYPALLAFVLFAGARGLSKRGWRVVAHVAGIAAIGGALADYVENARVAGLLRADPAALDAAMVQAASMATLLKSAFTTVAMSLVLILLLRWLLLRRKWGHS